MLKSMHRSNQESSSSSSLSRRYFNLRKHHSESFATDEEDNDHQTLTLTFPTQPVCENGANIAYNHHKHPTTAVSKIRSALTLFTKPKSNTHLGTKVIGTLFGSRKGHINFSIQEDPKSIPAFIIELPTSTSVLVKELASGIVRVLLECDKKRVRKSSEKKKLLMEPVWRSYCNGKKCGYAVRRECASEDWRVLKAVEMMTAGAGVLPEVEEGEGDVMYMRSKFERVVGSRNSEAFYMVSPEGSGGPELSVLLFRV